MKPGQSVCNQLRNVFPNSSLAKQFKLQFRYYNIWTGVQIMKLLTVQFSPVFPYFLPLRHLLGSCPRAPWIQIGRVEA